MTEDPLQIAKDYIAENAKPEYRLQSFLGVDIGKFDHDELLGILAIQNHNAHWRALDGS